LVSIRSANSRQRLRLRRLQLTAAFLAVLVILSTVIGAIGLGSRSSAPLTAAAS
jgi:hypothetical protein